MANPVAEASQIRNYNAKNYWVGQGPKQKCSVVISLASV